MVTALANIDDVLSVLGVNPADDAQAALASLYLREASDAVTTYCNRADFAVAQYARIRSGNNAPELALPDVPVQGLTLSGTTTQGSAVVTGLPTSGQQRAQLLFVNQSVTGAGVAAGSYVTDVSSAASGQVTLSAAATASGAASLAFGVAVFVDNNAFGGAAPGAFAAGPVGSGGTMLQEGVDYYLDYDNGPGGPCTSGLLYRLGYYWFRASAWIGGLVTPQTGPPLKNVKVQYLAGYFSVPPAVENACLNLIAVMRQARKWGRNPASLGNSDMSVSLPPPPKVSTGMFTEEIRSALANYVITPVADA